MVIANLANLQTLNTYVFSTTRKQQTSQDCTINVYSSKICPVVVEQQNSHMQKEFYTIHLNPEELSPKHKFQSGKYQ